MHALVVAMVIVMAFPTSAGALAAEPASRKIVIEKQWARASIGTSRPGVAYLTIRNDGKTAAVLIDVATPAAARAEVHESNVAGGMASMLPSGPILIPAGGSVQLSPGGLHIMLIGLNRPLQEGGLLPISLQFKTGATITVDVPILSIRAKGPQN